MASNRLGSRKKAAVRATFELVDLVTSSRSNGGSHLCILSEILGPPLTTEAGRHRVPRAVIDFLTVVPVMNV